MDPSYKHAFGLVLIFLFYTLAVVSAVNGCWNYPCKNGGTCTDIKGSYSCNCPIGWQGKTCLTDVNECLRFPCKNGGNCTNSDGSYACNCPIGWQGKNCSTGSTKESSVLGAALGSLGGVLVVAVPLILYVCPPSRLAGCKERRRRTMHRSDDI